MGDPNHKDTDSIHPPLFRARTQVALEAVQDLPNLNGEFIEINGEKHLVITRKVNFAEAGLFSKLISVGKNREMITLDLTSKQLTLLYETLFKGSDFFRQFTIIDKLKAVATFIKSKFKDDNAEQVVAHSHLKTTLSEEFVALPLEEFIEHRYCRHDVLLNAYLIHKLIQAKLLPTGDVFIRRQTISTALHPRIGHAWLEYYLNDELYLIDSTLPSPAVVAKVESKENSNADPRYQFYPEHLERLTIRANQATQPMGSLDSL